MWDTYLVGNFGNLISLDKINGSFRIAPRGGAILIWLSVFQLCRILGTGTKLEKKILHDIEARTPFA